MIERLLMLNETAGQNPSLLQHEEVQAVQRSRERLVELGCPSPHPEEMDLDIWLQREVNSNTGQPIVFYVNLDTRQFVASSFTPRLDTTWTPSAPHIDIRTLLLEVDRLTRGVRGSDSLPSGFQRFEVEGMEARQQRDRKFLL
ncbi:unnamed protein product [Symbiodinium pilosum]|uniref:Uncharacterized protein n=1 Tax=Symbiodinium pilosum TaxID=2952 RepID=A0A812SPS8_SYMPI|nr:unnamed protein product [Symbiodinium pilosum]